MQMPSQTFIFFVYLNIQIKVKDFMKSEKLGGQDVKVFYL